jgi:hypothetical protein
MRMRNSSIQREIPKIRIRRAIQKPPPSSIFACPRPVSGHRHR